jgi:hypothetical protein
MWGPHHLSCKMHLGFDEPNSFYRTFGAWTGTMPDKGSIDEAAADRAFGLDVQDMIDTTFSNSLTMLGRSQSCA